MPKSRFTERQIVGILKEGEAGGPDRGPGAEAQHQPRDVFQLAVDVRGHERDRAQAAEGTRGGERDAETDVYRARAGERRHQGCLEPTTVTPAARRQAIEVMTTAHRLSVRRSCRVAGLAQAAWYAPPVDATARDAAVIEALQRVVAANPRWRFWTCHDRLRFDGHGWKHTRVYPRVSRPPLAPAAVMPKGEYILSMPRTVSCCRR